jgi:hypothetical protein
MWSKLIERERRQAARYQVSLHASVIFLGSIEAAAEHPLAALGTTRDLSSEALTIFVPHFPFSGELTEAQRAFKVVLALPIGYVIVWARLIWSKEPPPEQPESGYLIAAQITDLSATDRTLYQEYLQALAAQS